MSKIVLTKKGLVDRICTFAFAKKKLYQIPSLNRVCFADSLSQCESKFTGYACKPATIKQSLKYVLLGR